MWKRVRTTRKKANTPKHLPGRPKAAEPSKPQHKVVIGDTPYDAAQAAGKAGIATIGVLSGGWVEDDLRQAGCIAVYKDPADLLASVYGEHQREH